MKRDDDSAGFGLIVTAEPYFAVSQPSDVVVMENEVRPETTGAVESGPGEVQLLKRGSYLMNQEASRLDGEGRFDQVDALSSRGAECRRSGPSGRRRSVCSGDVRESRAVAAAG